jgi:hypothetical protein
MKKRIELTNDVFFRNGDSKPNYVFRPPNYLKSVFEPGDFAENPITAFLDGLAPNKCLRVTVIVETEPDDGEIG